MTPVDQTIFASEVRDPNHTGNCYQACVASILDLPLDEIPRHQPDTKEFNAWLANHGLLVIRINNPADYYPWQIPDTFHLSIGRSPRTKLDTDLVTILPINHCVICRKGQLIHDPHPSRAGLIDDPLWYEFFAPISLGLWQIFYRQIGLAGRNEEYFDKDHNS